MPKSRKTGQESVSWSLDFQSLILPTASHGLSLSFLLSLISQNESSGRSPILRFAQGLDSEHVEFWMQRPRQPAACETSTHQRGAAARGCLTTSFLGQLCARRGMSLAAPKTDFAISSPHLQSPVGFL